MNTFTFVFTFGVIACASAGFVAPHLGYSSIPYGVAPGLVAAHGAYLAPGSGHEGQYVPSGLEKLYDDGSYKPEIQAVPLSPSPYGLTPAGSGLEGQYVPSGLETLHDDGSYKPEVHAIPLSPSPYGLTPAGSGLEGQYVPSGLEKYHDDGSYKPGLYHH